MSCGRYYNNSILEITAMSGSGDRETVKPRLMNDKANKSAESIFWMI